MIRLKDILNEAKILVYKVNDKKVQKFLKKYSKVEKSMKPFLKGDILRGYNKWLRWKDKNEDKLGGKPDKVDSKSFGSKVFWKHDWNGVSGWAEVFQYLHTLDEGKLSEAIGKGMKWEDLKSGTSIEFTGGTTYVVTKIDKNKLQMSLKRRGKTGGGLFAPKAKLDKSQFESQVKVGFIKYLVNTNPRG